jgi:hypothetical protein
VADNANVSYPIRDVRIHDAPPVSLRKRNRPAENSGARVPRGAVSMANIWAEFLFSDWSCGEFPHNQSSDRQKPTTWRCFRFTASCRHFGALAPRVAQDRPPEGLSE